MKYNRQFIKIISVAFFIVSFKLNAQNCQQLIHYRDVELNKQYNDAVEKYTKKYKLNHEIIADMQRTKRETLDEKEWGKLMSTQTTMTDGGLTTAIIAKNIQITCTLISDLLKIVPAADVAGTTIEKTSLTAESVLKVIESGKSLKSIVTEDAEKTAYREVLSKINPLTKAVKTAWNFAEGVQKMVAMPEDRDKLKSEVERILNMVDNAVSKYQKEIDDNSANVKQLNEIQIGITQYLNEHCDKTKFKGDIKMQKRDLTQTKKTIPANNQSKASTNFFYIFLTVSIEIKPKASQFSNLQSSKKIFIISAPILHQGSLSDSMVQEKKQFFLDIERQFNDKPESLKELLESNDFEGTKVHYGKPYSKALLRTKEEGLEAIEAYKKSTKDLLDGLEQFDFYKLQ